MTTESEQQAGIVTMADIDALSESQRDVLGQIAMNQDGGHNPRTLKSLLKRGLIEVALAWDRRFWPAVQIRRYSVPVHVHVAWCAWCTENCPMGSDEPTGDSGELGG
ncbi:MAG: hypothetical protein ACYTAO_17650 [Planctomycetota bacterium]|jgi:hypothetical protein